MKNIEFLKTNRREFINIIKEVALHPKVQEMKKYRQHYDISCYKHSLEVAFLMYKHCKIHNLDYKSATRASMLHDLFLYDWRKHQENLPVKGKHAFAHPKIALINATKYFKLDDIEKDCIVKHMWPVTFFHFPKYRESFYITIADKLSALHSFKLHYFKKQK